MEEDPDPLAVEEEFVLDGDIDDMEIREDEDGRARTSGNHSYSDSADSAGISFPVYVKVPRPSEQLAIAFFPMSTSNRLPGAKISAVTRNSVDGRIRCEIRDSTIHGREETTDGIPVDYHMVWESSGVPANTYRDDYFAVKQNGKLFLTPAQTVHMRTVVEPKGTRQSESQRIGIVVHSGSREAQQAAAAAAQGKWIPYDLTTVSSEEPYPIEESAIRHAVPSAAVDAASLEAVIPIALSLKSTTPAVVTSAGTTIGAPRPAGSLDLEKLFKSCRIYKMARIIEATGKPLEDAVQALHGYAYLVQGVWVGCGSLFFNKPASASDNNSSIAFSFVFDYLLSFFVRDRLVDITAPKQALKLSPTTLNALLGMMGKHVGGDRWRFLEETDTCFIAENPEIVQKQAKAWDDRRATIEHMIAECGKTAAATALLQCGEESVAAPPAGRKSVPVKRSVAGSAAVASAKRIADEMKVEGRAEIRSGGGSGGRGGMRGRGRGEVAEDVGGSCIGECVFRIVRTGSEAMRILQLMP